MNILNTGVFDGRGRIMVSVKTLGQFFYILSDYNPLFTFHIYIYISNRF